jgi:hypothetical protein
VKILVTNTAASSNSEAPGIGTTVERPSISTRNGSFWPLIAVLLVAILVGALIWRKTHALSRRITERVPRSEPEQQPHPTPAMPTAVPASIKHKEPERRTYQHRADPEHVFNLQSGGKLRDLGDLRSALRNMDAKVFDHHVTGERNDFSEWVETTLGLPRIAAAIRRAHTKEELRRILDHELE